MIIKPTVGEEMKITNINELMDFENKVIVQMDYSSGGYYKGQSENQKIYQTLKRKLMNVDLSWFKSNDYKILEDENYHSLNALIQDIKKELKAQIKKQLEEKE